jgi:hypothetical protein
MPVYLRTIYLTIGYPQLEDADKRKAVWLTNVPLGKTHELRAKINNGKTPDAEILSTYDAAVIASALKLYLLELPGIPFVHQTNKILWSHIQSTT